jgi:hypothetical protein
MPLPGFYQSQGATQVFLGQQCSPLLGSLVRTTIRGFADRDNLKF